VTEKEQESELEEARLAVAKKELEAARTEVCSTQSELKKLEPRLSFSPKLPTSLLLSILVSSERKLASALLA
jgi:chaperonin GroEL (HSP60 family)